MGSSLNTVTSSAPVTKSGMANFAIFLLTAFTQTLFAMESGIKLLQRDRPELMYLSLTDYVQHAHAPGSPEANDFYHRLDDAFGRLHALGAVVALITWFWATGFLLLLGGELTALRNRRS